jgi:hypothetical protein
MSKKRKNGKNKGNSYRKHRCKASFYKTKPLITIPQSEVAGEDLEDDSKV